MTAPAGHEPIALEPQPTFRDHNFTYRIEFLEHPPVVAVTTSEHVNLSGWARLHEELLADPRVKELPLLLDHSKLDATFLHSDSVRMMGKIASDIDKELQPPRRAIVIAGGFQLGPIRKSRAQLDVDVDVERSGISDHEGPPSTGSSNKRAIPVDDPTRTKAPPPERVPRSSEQDL